MIARASAPSPTRRLVSLLSPLAMSLAGLALISLGAAPLGWRSGLLSLKGAFGFLFWAEMLGTSGAIFAALGLVLSWRMLGRVRVALLSCIVLLGVAFVAVPLHVRDLHAPPINDITTDTENPPAIVAALAARHAEQAVSEVYGGPDVARLQKEAYPDVAPLTVPLPVSRAFDVALGIAKVMPGWNIIGVDQQAGRIEATQSSFWFGFVDDIVIRVTVVGSGSRIDMRSHSRHGRGDLGVNAARIRRYFAALKQATG